MKGPTQFTAEFATRQERVEVLRVAANVLRSRWPLTRAEVLVWVGINRLQAHAAMEWPGVIRVTTRYGGELLAQSKPGKPFELDSSSRQRR